MRASPKPKANAKKKGTKKEPLELETTDEAYKTVGWKKTHDSMWSNELGIDWEDDDTLLRRVFCLTTTKTATGPWCTRSPTRLPATSPCKYRCNCILP